MKQKVQISANIGPELLNAIGLIAEKEKRSFSSMVAILLIEAVEKRSAKKQKPQIQ